MPSATTKGYPYPLGTDRISDSDTVIQDLAQKVNNWLGKTTAGTLTVPSVPAGGSAQLAVTFPAGFFPVAPVVQVSANGNNPGITLASPTGISATGFTAVGYRGGGAGTVVFCYVAFLLP